MFRFRSPHDFESPHDSNGHNDYKVTIKASDGSLADSRNVTVTVTNRASTIDSGLSSVDYAEGGTGSVGSYSASDPCGGPITWSLPDTGFETDRGDFDISSDGALTFDSSPDHENPEDSDRNNVYRVTVRASDGNTSDSGNVTVTVTDVDEPPDKPSAPTVTANGETSLNVEWSAPTNTGPPINDYDVQYRVGSSGRFTSAVHTGTATHTTISDLDPDSTYEVQVLARNAEGTSAWSRSGTGSTDAAPVPTVTIAPLEDVDSVGEGQLVPFTLTAKPAPTAELKVKVSVAETGSFLASVIPTDVTIAPGSSTALLTLQTTNDMIDEENGTVTVTISSGTGYSVGSPSSASVTVRDDDLSRPPQPEGVSASSTTGDTAEVRWSHINGVEAYRLQYREANKVGWRSIDVEVSSPRLSETENVTITSLKCETRYRFRVRGSGDRVVYLGTWGPYSDVVFATTGDCGTVTPPPTPPTQPTPHPESDQYAALIQPSNIPCANPFSDPIKHSGSRVNSSDGRHEAHVKLYTVRDLSHMNLMCVGARFTSESAPGADRISIDGKFYETEAKVNLEGLVLGQLGFLDRFRIADRYEDQPLTEDTPDFRSVSWSCDTCRGGSFQTEFTLILDRLLKIPTIFAVGEHAFSVGGATVELKSQAEMKAPGMIPQCQSFITCGPVVNRIIEDELSEDVDTGLLGDAIGLIAGIAAFFLD